MQVSIIHSEVVDSTNACARRWLAVHPRSEILLPVVFTAERQTAGRGRGANRWYSPEGCLMFSILFSRQRWNLTLEQSSLLGLAAGLALVDTCVHFFPQLESRIKIHWPNDVYDHGLDEKPRKLSGILTEGISNGNMILGMGVNFTNHSECADDPELACRMVSLIELLPEGTELPAKEAFLSEILNGLDARFSLLSEDSGAVISAVDAICSQKGAQTTLRTPRGTVHGLCSGLSPDGGLCIDGKTYYTGDSEG